MRLNKTTLRILDQSGAKDTPPQTVPPMETPTTTTLPMHNTPTNPATTHILDHDRMLQLRDVWGHEIFNDPNKVRAITKAQDEISEEAGKVLQAAINMGRALLDVKRVLSPSEFARGLRDSPKAWRGLSRGNVAKLMSVAEWWDEGKLPVDAAPKYYTVLYEFTTLEADEFQQALARGVFRDDVSRSEVISFKKSLKSAGGQSIEPPIEPPTIELNPLDMLREKRRKLLLDLLDVRREMQALMANTSSS